MPKEKLVIGRTEIADLPTFRLKNKVVKIDSGAYSSSIDAVSAKVDGEKLKVQFEPDGDIITFDSWTTKTIKSSNGFANERFIIIGKIILGDSEYKTRFSLTDRSGMRYPILLGRKLLNKHFIIDTSRTNVLRKPL